MRTIRVLPDKEAVSRSAADEFVRSARDAIWSHGQFTVALSGGSTPRRLYQLLVEPPYRDVVDWPKVQIFWGDERCVPPTDPESNYRMAKESLLDKLQLAPQQVHRMEAERGDREQAAQDYQAEIAKVFGVPSDGFPPAFDLVLLGMGPDGHTASLFPNSAALAETKRWVTANFVSKFNTWRLTFTRSILRAAREAIFLVTGDDKADRLVEVLQGPPDMDRLPAQSIQAARTLWLLDEAAAAKLK